VRRLSVLALVAALLAGCGTISAGQAVRAWLHQSDYSHNRRTIATEVVTAESELDKPGTSAVALHTICGVLVTDVEAANASLPTPDRQATALLARAYVSLGEGANTCYNAAASWPARTAAHRYLDRGLAQLSFATLRLAVAGAR
jgi:hypothetical protein